MPPTIDNLITTIEVEQQQAEKRRDSAVAHVQFILARAQEQGRSNLTDQESKEVKDRFAERDKAKADIIGITERLQVARRAKAEQLETEHELEQRQDTGSQRPSYDRVMRVGNEERTYRQDFDRKGSQFLRDVARQFLFRDMDSEQRLLRHMQEERVLRPGYLERAAGDTTTANWAGLVVPQYLTDMYAPATATLRPFADICNKHDLPANGMTVNISRVTTPSSVALQATELTAVSATSLDDTLLTENVQTAAGQQTLSRQAIERGTGVEEVVLDDLFRRYASTLDATLLNQATTGLAAVANATAYTSTAPTAAGLWPKVLGAAAGVEASLLGFAVPTHAVMHSRRWYWMQSQIGTGQPFIQQPGLDTPFGGINTGEGYGSTNRGILPNGMRVVVDNNIATNAGAGTNEDAIFVVPQAECHLWEDPNAPVFIRAEQPAAANLGVLVVLYGYFAYSFRRYTAAMQAITGTGLVPPTF